jgi:excisionase family DNA binding protein
MTIDETAAELGISRSGAYAAARTGQIPVVRVGRRLLVPRAAFHAWLAAAGPVPPLTVQREFDRPLAWPAYSERKSRPVQSR